MALVKAVSILRVDDQTILFNKTYNKKNIDNDLKLVQQHIDQVKPRAEERVSLKTANGKWSYKLDDHNIAYATLTTEQYPERQIFAMIKEMEKELKKMPDYSLSSPNEVEKYVKIWMKDLQDKYDNLSGIDKVACAQEQIDSVQLIMEDNVRKMLDNNTQIDNLDGKAEKMKDQSKAFHTQAHDLARIMYWRNVKLKILIGLIVLAVLLYIIVPIIISANST